MNTRKLVNIIMYVIALIVFIYVLKVDFNDWHCENPKITAKGADCNDTNGYPYRGSQPYPNDSCNTLLDKIVIASHADEVSVKWRRALASAIIVVFLIFFFVVTPVSLPYWWVFYISVLVSMFALYFISNYYSFHVYSIPSLKIEESVKYLRPLCGRN